jgi:hypothetical protein
MAEDNRPQSPGGAKPKFDLEERTAVYGESVIHFCEKLPRTAITKPLIKLHNAMWPGLVGKGDGEGQEPPISLEKMLQLTAAANVNGQKFDGIDYFLFFPHTNPEASDAEFIKIADQIASYGFSVGSLVAPVWPGTVGDSAMGDDAPVKNSSAP